jgi:predicted dehydrogenase
MSTSDDGCRPGICRRDALRQTLAAAAPLALPALGLAADPPPAAPRQFERKIKVGLIGCGGRGAWIGKLFAEHGGYVMHAVADYFPSVADRFGESVGIDKSRRFSGLSGYQKAIASGVEALILETPPYFFPEHAQAAVAAGLYVYMAKPVAVDVPGCLAIEAAGKLATQKQRCFRVDYQMPTDPINIEVRNRIVAGGLGKIAFMASFGFTNGFADPPKTANIESRLQSLVWVNDVALGCDYIGNYDIHAIDAALWIAGQRPTSAAGASRICRPDPHGDSRDVCSVVYEFADGLVLNHTGQALKNNADGLLMCQVFGDKANAQVNYWGKAFVRGGEQHYGGGSINELYAEGAKRNIAAFYDDVTAGRCENPTVQRAVDGCLTTILGREAAARHVRLTMQELLSENRRLEVDLRGLAH